MSWERLCELASAPVESATLFTVNGREVLFLRTKYALVAMPSLCVRMRQPLMEGHFEECFANGVPLCNGDQDGPGAAASAGVGVASTPLMGYAVREENGVVYIDMDLERPLEDYQHVTCSPELSGDGTGRLVVNLWKEGFDNEMDSIRQQVTLKAAKA